MSTVEASKLFILGFAGEDLGRHEHEFLRKNSLGGLILFKRNIADLEQVVALNSYIINANKSHPPIISVDQEGGRVARLRGICTDVPPLADLENVCLKDPQMAFRIGALLGRELVALGFSLNFAPVCDIATNKDSQVIGNRSFSDDPQIVAMLCAQMIKGLQGAGIAACAKHFPGHGATHLDSHLLLPIIDTPMTLLEERELVPFKAAIDVDVASIMTAHIIIKSLSKEYPATLSPVVLSDLLRKKLIYSNLIISDDLDMKAVADHWSLKEILERGLDSSVDLFIIGNDFNKGIEAINILQDLLDNNTMLAQKAAIAIERLEKFRARYIGKPLAPNINDAKKIVRCSPHLELIERCV